MKRGSYLKVDVRNKPIVKRIKEIKSDHPFWGYRRVWAHLNYIDEMRISQNKVYRLMQVHDLIVTKNTRLKARRKAHTKKPKPTTPNTWWGIDMTKVMIENYGWVYVTIVIDWHTKKVVGHHAGDQSKAWHWLLALNKGAQLQFKDGVRSKGLKLMSDNGCQPTSRSFMSACASMGIKQAFTSYNNPKGNADTERFMRTMKEELVWIHEWRSPTQFYKALESWLDYYNTTYLHSTLGYKSPCNFEREFKQKQSQETLLENAC